MSGFRRIEQAAGIDGFDAGPVIVWKSPVNPDAQQSFNIRIADLIGRTGSVQYDPNLVRCFQLGQIVQKPLGSPYHITAAYAPQAA